MIRWSYCYYTRGGQNNIQATFVVFRSESPGSSTYIPVPGSVIDIFLDPSNITSSSFECRNKPLGPSEQFEIQENDVIGACIWNEK